MVMVSPTGVPKCLTPVTQQSPGLLARVGEVLVLVEVSMMHSRGVSFGSFFFFFRNSASSDSGREAGLNVSCSVEDGELHKVN